MKQASKLFLKVAIVTFFIGNYSGAFSQAPSTAGSPGKGRSAAAELQNFSYDQSDPMLSDLYLAYLKLKVDLEHRQQQGALNTAQVAEYKGKIGIAFVKLLQQPGAEKKYVLNYDDKKISSADLRLMTDDTRKEIITLGKLFEWID